MVKKKNEESIHRFRALPSLSSALENDPDPMVHQQLARLKLLENRLNGQRVRILEFGSGFGFNCQYLSKLPGVEKVVGFDLKEEVVRVAQQRYPDIEFFVADACDLSLNINAGEWDYVIAFEVIEHLKDKTIFLENMKKHLKNDGVAFISTPNRLTFSLGHKPSPINKEHLEELDLEELLILLEKYFPYVELVGQQFRRKELLDAWKEDVIGKIQLLHSGVRWLNTASIRQKLRRIKLIDRLYQIPLFQNAWKRLRWSVIGYFENQRAIKKRPYSYFDFEFVSYNFTDSLWFCAFLRLKQ